MRWFKNIIFFSPLIFIAFELVFYYNQKTNYLDPINTQQQKIITLENELRLSQINYTNLEIYNYRHEAEFIVNIDNQSIKVIVSLQKETLSQVTALQKMLKKANIKKEIKLIDLSSEPAYATFQDF